MVDTISDTRPLAIISESSDKFDLTGHNMLMTFLYVLSRAARGKERLSVLDWGGALGHFGLVARRLLPEVPIDYLVKDHPRTCQLGGKLNPTILFTSDDDGCLARSYDVVVANSSLQYIHYWKPLVARLSQSANPWLLINAVPVVKKVPSFVIVQRKRSRGFSEAFYSWAFNRDELISEVAGHGFRLERELMAWGDVFYWGSVEVTQGGGFLFRKT
jgi:putative methyltransferase (TIGR04325 family)